MQLCLSENTSVVVQGQADFCFCIFSLVRRATCSLTGINSRTCNKNYNIVFAGPNYLFFSCAQAPVEYSRITLGQTMAACWRGCGAKHFPTLGNVARAVLGAPGSAAVLERHLVEARKLVKRQRGSLDPFFVQMVMFFRGAYDPIPEDAPALTVTARGCHFNKVERRWQKCKRLRI